MAGADASGLKKTGVRLVAEGGPAFTAALTGAKAAVTGFTNTARTAASAGVVPLANAAKTTGTALGTMGAVAGGIAAAGMNILNIATGVLVAQIGMSLFNAVQGGIISIREFAETAVHTAARVDELGLVLDVLGPRAGKTSAEMDAMVQSLKDTGIQTDVAMNQISQMIRYQLDLSKATELARVAQDTAVLSMMDSSQELSAIMYGIQTYNSEVLRTAGLNIQVGEAFKKYATEIGKTAEALTTAERQQAVMNAVLEEGARNAGLYEAAMKSPSKQLRTLSRDMYELSAALGAPFTAAMLNAVMRMRESTNAWTEAISEGGRLYETVQKMGFVAEWFSEKWREGSKKTTDVIIDMIAKMAGNFEGAAGSALQWGINIMVQFGSGIIQGAAWALTEAMKFVSSILSWFLAPGSPPKVAPDLPKWGMKAMAEFLHGMASADFGVLKAIQSPLQNVLGVLTQTGEITKKESGKAFKNISVALAKALDTGTGEAEVFRQIAKAGGPFGDELARLAKLQFQAADAAEAVTAAEKALQAAQQAEFNTLIKANSAVNEYNDMLRSGASKDALKSARERIDLARKERNEAVAARVEAEAGLETTQEQAQAAAEQASNQQDVLNQLLEITKAQIDTTAAGGGGGGGGMPPIELPDVSELGGGGGGGISKSMEELREKIRKQLEDMFEPAKTAWEEDIKPAIAGVETEFERLRNNLLKFKIKYIEPMAEWFTPFTDKLKGIIPPDVIESIGKFIGAILGIALIIKVVSGVMGAFSLVLSVVFNPIFALVVLIGLLIATIQAYGAQAWQSIQMIGGIISMLWTNMVNMVGASLSIIWATIEYYVTEWGASIQAWADRTREQFTEWKATMKERIETALADIKQGFKDAKDNVVATITQWGANIQAWADETRGKFQTWIDNVKEYIETKVGELKTNWETFWSGIKEWADTTIGEIKTNVEGWIDGVKTKIEDTVEAIKTGWEEKWTAIKDFLVDNIQQPILDFISNVLTPLQAGWDAVSLAIKGVWDWLVALAEKIKNWTWGKLGEVIPDSPPPLVVGLEMSGEAMRKLAQVELPRLKLAAVDAQVSPIAPPEYARGRGSEPAGREIRIEFGDVHISNGMDLAAFEARVKSVIAGEL